MRQTTHRLLLTAAIGLVSASGAAQAQATWPSKPITFVVPSAPGGSTDYIARLVAEPLSKALGQAIVIDNRPGGAGNIGAESGLRGGSDGYTFLVQYSGYHVGNPALFPGMMRWSPTKDYTGVAMLMRAPHVIALSKNVPTQTLRELIDQGRRNSKGLTYASSGPGSIQHIAGEMFHRATGVAMTHVPYKGAGPATNDLLGGQVDVFITTPPAVIATRSRENSSYSRTRRPSATPRYPTCPPLRKRACRGTRWSPGSRCSPPPQRPNGESRSSLRKFAR